jgi:DNA-binding protein HU-beta
MNKTELIDAISSDTGLSRRQAESALDAFVFQVTAGVWAGNPVRITGFGTFKLRERAARRGRNPQTGAAVKIKASRGIGFTPGLGLKADLNAKRAPRKPATVTAAPAPAPVAKKAAAKSPAVKTTASKAVAKKTATAAKAPAAAKKAPTKTVAKAAAAKKTTTAKKAGAKRA